MVKQIKAICKACQQCQVAKVRRQQLSAAFEQADKEDLPFPRQAYGIDIGRNRPMYKRSFSLVSS